MAIPVLMKLRQGLPSITKLLRVLTMGRETQNFIGSVAVPLAFTLTPQRFRHSLALRIIAISPHYFSRQWAYPVSMPRLEVLHAEDERLRRSRGAIVDSILAGFIDPSMTVLDFGCGPGYLASFAAERAALVYGVDISRGALLCAEQLNPGCRIRYLHAQYLPAAVAAGTVDLIYSFAVLQHMSTDEIGFSFTQFHRLLRTVSGMALCHVHLADGLQREDVIRGTSNPEGSSRYILRFQYLARAELVELARRAGFPEAECVPIRERFGLTIDDDISNGHLLILRKRR